MIPFRLTDIDCIFRPPSAPKDYWLFDNSPESLSPIHVCLIPNCRATDLLRGRILPSDVVGFLAPIESVPALDTCVTSSVQTLRSTIRCIRTSHVITATVLLYYCCARRTYLRLFALPLLGSFILSFCGFLPSFELGTGFTLMPCRLVFDTMSIIAGVTFESRALGVDLASIAVGLQTPLKFFNFVQNRSRG
jgi:hypothetical protein